MNKLNLMTKNERVIDSSVIAKEYGRKEQK
jgi:hypothetical protein